MQIEVVGTDALVEQALADKNSAMPEKKVEEQDRFKSSLAGHVGRCYFDNKQARKDSGIEDEMLEGMKAFNGEFMDSRSSNVEEQGGSRIFMNLTATKCRACASWIKDILMPSQGRAWRLIPPKEPEIDPRVMKKIEDLLEREYSRIETQAEEQGSPPPGPDQGAQPAQPGSPTPAGSPVQPPALAAGQPAPQGQTDRQEQSPAISMATKLREMNKAKRDIMRTFKDEVDLVARFELDKLERRLEDDLMQGDWDRALSEFIEDFTIYPAAVMKGPIMCMKPTLTYNGGAPISRDELVYVNKRISPLDIYPSANATCMQDGNIIEHCRFERYEISDMKKMGAEAGYDVDRIDKVLEHYKGEEFIHWLWTDIESDKAEAEKRGTEFQANKNIIHGLHYFGKAPVSLLRDWGYEEGLEGKSDTDQVEIEALLIDNDVIKCLVNDDPLSRRPYYKASFQSRPGSFWGRSLPNLMRDIQRMCNATARALANNMGVASGPQLEVVIERLADRGDIGEVEPMKIWQTNADPTGAGGRAIQFHQPSSNAAELLAVFKEFELRADDATGIPRYAYGNERTGGAAQTASGLSMLLESASKGIKDAIRHIDHGLIIPRIEYQFYWLMKDNDLDYSGALKVQGIGSAALTMKAAEQAKRVELMQALSGNPQILEVVGPEAMAHIFKTLFEDANMDEIVIPSGLEIRQKVAEREAQAAEAAKMQSQMEQQKMQVGLQATKEQIGGQERMHQQTMQLKVRELDLKEKSDMAKSRDKAQELDSRERQTAQKVLSDAERSKAERDFNDDMDRRRLAFELTDLQEDKSPTDAAGGRT